MVKQILPLQNEWLQFIGTAQNTLTDCSYFMFQKQLFKRIRDLKTAWTLPTGPSHQGPHIYQQKAVFIFKMSTTKTIFSKIFKREFQDLTSANSQIAQLLQSLINILNIRAASEHKTSGSNFDFGLE